MVNARCKRSRSMGGIVSNSSLRALRRRCRRAILFALGFFPDSQAFSSKRSAGLCPVDVAPAPTVIRLPHASDDIESFDAAARMAGMSPDACRMRAVSSSLPLPPRWLVRVMTALAVPPTTERRLLLVRLSMLGLLWSTSSSPPRLLESSSRRERLLSRDRRRIMSSGSRSSFACSSAKACACSLACRVRHLAARSRSRAESSKRLSRWYRANSFASSLPRARQSGSSMPRQVCVVSCMAVELACAIVMREACLPRLCFFLDTWLPEKLGRIADLP
mmetsp:Transcript_100680/g.260003  ORF Transcript_100680/g.260003 Transcript_100680/m.260003 type:complete len:276 (+) Transcript_100680:1527-2354(+)